LKILFFGLGSIGKRHASIIKKYHGHELFAFRTNKGQEINDLKIAEVHNYDDAFKIKPDVAFITNPTFMHIDTALKCTDKGIDMFIEKPLSNSFEGIDKLKQKIKEKNIFVYIGHCMRFHPVIQYLKENVNIDDVIYTKTTSTSFLPNWRPKQDYSKSFCVDSNRGGGVLLELIHEIDYNSWLFGEIDNIKGKYGAVSNLKSDCEDFAELSVSFKNNIFGDIHLNWFSHNSERVIKIYCNDKYIEGDLLKNEVLIKKDGEDIKKIKFDVERNDIYKAQLDYFFDSLKKNITPMNNLFEASDSLKKILDFKKTVDFLKIKR